MVAVAGALCADCSPSSEAALPERFICLSALLAATGRGTTAVGPSSATRVLMAEASAAIRPEGSDGTRIGDVERELLDTMDGEEKDGVPALTSGMRPLRAEENGFTIAGDCAPEGDNAGVLAHFGADKETVHNGNGERRGGEDKRGYVMDKIGLLVTRCAAGDVDWGEGGGGGRIERRCMF